jgi:hypothetical protein
MNKIEFITTKQKLQGLIISIASESEISNSEKTSISRLLKLLIGYTYENRLQVQGTIARTIIDSFELPHELAAEFIKFDNGLK